MNFNYSKKSENFKCTFPFIQGLYFRVIAQSQNIFRIIIGKMIEPLLNMDSCISCQIIEVAKTGSLQICELEMSICACESLSPFIHFSFKMTKL